MKPVPSSPPITRIPDSISSTGPPNVWSRSMSATIALRMPEESWSTSPRSRTTDGYPDGYLEQMRMQSLGSAAGELLKLGFAADAATLYNESIGLAKDIPADAPELHRQSGGPTTPADREGLTRALDELKPEDLASSLTRMIAGSEAASSQKATGPNHDSSSDEEGRPAPEPGCDGASSRARQGDDPQPAGRHDGGLGRIDRRPTS